MYRKINQFLVDWRKRETMWRFGVGVLLAFGPETEVIGRNLSRTYVHMAAINQVPAVCRMIEGKRETAPVRT